MSGSTEESILGTIPDLDDGGSYEADGGSSSSQAPSQSSDSGGGRSSAQPTQSDSTGSGTQQPNQQPIRRRHDGLHEVPNAENPNTRDLVDPISGRVVARGGIERKIFEDGQRATRENNQLKVQLGNASRQLASINEVTQEAVRLNVAPQDQVVAIRVMSDFMRDPVKTLEYLVEEVRSKGYPIPFLQQGVNPGMDMNAIARMIDNKMQPITQAQQRNVQEQQVRQRAEADLNTFLESNQEANQNLDVLSEMLQAQPTLSLNDAYMKMVRWSHENGLDWTQNLKQQIAAQRSQQTTQQPEQRQSRPLPGGRSVGNGAQPVNGATPQQHNENTSWSDIIRQAMHENGVTLN